MRPLRTIIRTVFVVAFAPLFSACSDGHDYQADILAKLPDLSCQGLAKASPARWKTATSGRWTVARSQFLTIDESEAVLRHFDEIGYDYDGVRQSLQPVPRVYLAKMPVDLPDINEPDTRKKLFLAAMLPAVLQVNEEIRETRRRLVAIAACEYGGYAANMPVQAWVANLAERYRCEPKASALLRKIGEIPPSLALAQAAVESGWGTSNPAQSFNSLFGQYTVLDDQPGGDGKKGGWPVGTLRQYPGGRARLCR